MAQTSTKAARSLEPVKAATKIESSKFTEGRGLSPRLLAIDAPQTIISGFKYSTLGNVRNPLARVTTDFDQIYAAPRFPIAFQSMKRPLPDLTFPLWVIALLAEDMISEREHIHLRSPKTINRLLGPAHQWLVFVKRSVKYHWHAGQILELLD
jgi:hypothetical protein